MFSRSVFEFESMLAGVLIPLTSGLNQSHGSSGRQESTAITMGDVSVGKKHAELSPWRWREAGRQCKQKCGKAKKKKHIYNLKI